MTPEQKRFMWLFSGGVAALFFVLVLVVTTGALGYILDP